MAPEEIDEHFAPVRAPTVHTVELDGEAVLLDEDRNVLHRLNATATLVWACLDGTATVAEIVADLAAAFAVPPSQIGSEVLAVLRQLDLDGLLDHQAGGTT